uniref:SAP domain-containing protein n=1 Tax=Amphora coffeiformis TaxID=265554 RepID=A0A7S3LDT3_9STRA|mmetsp:Transcript_3239/g.6190  ORF Transcript_3239/g.6190 Transcript_3239/m.6190 type:complete len:739 (+) Transcript_3239:63-2279(+)
MLFLFPFLALFGSSLAFAPFSEWHRPVATAPSRSHLHPVNPHLTTTTGVTRKNRRRHVVFPLGAKLWDRLQIEEDPEPFWYLINCVAGLEIDLLRQCREVCKDMPDAVKFVVPTEKKTRSHGAKRMVTETKVKYQGYVFAKLRLCPEVYEAIQGLDLCRSWMGTVNHKGHKKLPPAPIALNELEVENFGLEECEGEEKEDENSGDIIVDVKDEDAEEKLEEMKEALKVYLGLKVDDMVKVTAKGKFFNEDGIIRRLKEGKLLVRFYTYGTMFEEWLDPTDVRKLSNIEILKGLSGPTKPVTQRDFDDPSDDRRPGDRNFMPDARGGAGPRNRRQDRTERRFRQDGFQSDEERGQNDRNWNWYQNNQQDQRRRNDYGDHSHGYQAGINNNNQRRDRGGDWAIGNVDSQWGRNSPQNNNRERQPRRDNRRQNDLADAALRGDDDWSAFVTPAGGGRSGADKSSGGGDDNDFFASLMSDLSSDLGSSGAPTSKSSSQSVGSSDDDDFFASLMSEISDDDAPTKPKSQPKQKETPVPPSGSSNDEDFFAALEAELGSAFEGDSTSKLDDSDDLFAKLEAELSPQNDATSEKPFRKTAPPSKKASAVSDSISDDFFADLEAELSPSGSGSGDAQVDSADDFFAELEADLAPLSEGAKESSSAVVLDDLLGDMNEKQEEAPATKTKKSAPKQSAPAASPAAPPSVNTGDLQKQTIPALKDMLRERGLKVSGKKSELIERLLQES